MNTPYLFDEFFASGREESISPFLTPSSRKWGRNLPLKSASLSALLLALSFSASFFNPLLSSLLLVVVYFLVGTPALIGTVDDLKNFEINIDVLMTLAALLSVVIGSGMEGALLLVLFEFSAAMESAVTQKTKSALVTLNRLSPRTACVVHEDGSLFEQSVREISKGAKLLVKAGEIVPLDGVVLQGRSSVNLAHLTGESQPVFMQPGDEVAAGALNIEGALTIEVSRSSADSTLSRIINLIAHAQEAKPRLVRLIDRFGKGYALIVMGLFFFFALTLPWLLSIPYLGTEGSIYRALTFLIAASPCALIIATPTAYLSAISSCAKRGILLKGGVIFDGLARCTTMAFDKTGTLTTGTLQCISFSTLSKNSPYSEELALSVAAAIERNAVHPIAEAILRLAEERGVSPHQIDHFKSTPGSGLEAEVTTQKGKVHAYIGNADFVLFRAPAFETLLSNKSLEGELSTFLLLGDALFVFKFVDAIRPGAREVMRTLKEKQKLDLIMLTGDRIENATYVAKALGIEEVFAALRPEHKLEKVAELARTKGLVMVGDGINDAPALTRATIGISLGRVASATAMDASDVILLSEELSLLPWLINKSRDTLSIVKQNLSLALAVILFATTPALLGFIPLWAAVLLHEGGTVLVGLNSLRLKK
ncbi:MAG: heavy metal translocating P-type ATPase [Chlamydiales bacterium]|nr:heavy metal translocating P-type ATPase [Chlamydiales bacterium]